jgi:hypothetical protein
LSGYSWTLPGGTSSVPATTPSEDQQLALLGKDIFFDGDFRMTPARDFLLIEGVEAMRQAIYRRLLTKPGEYAARPDYGVGVQLWVKRRRSASSKAELVARIKDQLSLDRRIDEVISVVLEDLPNGLQVAIKVRVAGEAIQFRPFEFTEGM